MPRNKENHLQNQGGGEAVPIWIVLSLKKLPFVWWRLFLKIRVSGKRVEWEVWVRRYVSEVWFGVWFAWCLVWFVGMIRGVIRDMIRHKFCHSWKHSDMYRSTIAFDISFCLQNVYRNELGSNMFNLNHPKRTYYTNFKEKTKQCVEESPGCSNIWSFHELLVGGWTKPIWKIC